jgi:hypothetical protein
VPRIKTGHHPSSNVERDEGEVTLDFLFRARVPS